MLLAFYIFFSMFIFAYLLDLFDEADDEFK